MGTSFETSQSVDQQTAGIIPRAAHHFFDGIVRRQEEARKAGKVAPSFEVAVQFIEVSSLKEKKIKGFLDNGRSYFSGYSEKT